MGLREFFRRKGAARKKASPPARSASSDSTAPKNGRLTVAVVAVIVLMLVLAALNVRLILDPSIAGKAFGPWVPSRPETEADQSSSQSCPARETTNPAPPQVTFYSKLVAEEEQTRPPEASDGDHAVQRDGSPAICKNHAPEETKPPDKHAEKRARSHASLRAKQPVRAVPAETSLPGPDSGTGTYTVQVGAFTNPGIAQQWAVRWKSRGYEVLLKPVARPKTGILYRLYLGKFSSQQEADALVERLKVREGITAFRLLVRN